MAFKGDWGGCVCVCGWGCVCMCACNEVRLPFDMICLILFYLSGANDLEVNPCSLTCMKNAFGDESISIFVVLMLGNKIKSLL